MQARPACTGNRQQLSGSESRGPVHLKGNTMIASNYRKFPEALALQMPLQFGRLLVWATSRPTTRLLRAIRAERGAAFKAAGRVAYPVRKTTPSWARELAKKVRDLGKLVKAAQVALVFAEPVKRKGFGGHIDRMRAMRPLARCPIAISA